MIYIVIRKTLDWDDRAAFLAQLRDDMREGVALWDATFNMPFHIYRRELKRIAGLNLSALEGASCVPIQEVPRGELVVPVDDDDWFSPDLARVLECAADEATAYYWPRRFLEIPTHFRHEIGLIRRRIFPATKPRFLCNTNNYAFRWRDERQDILLNHSFATDWYLANLPEVKKLDRPLSLINRTLASITQLSLQPSRSQLLRKYRRYRRLYLKPPLEDMRWCTPYLEQMRELHKELSPVE